MHKKITPKSIRTWLANGEVDLIEKYWNTSTVQAFRETQLNSIHKNLSGEEHNAWVSGVRNGKTFMFLLENDIQFTAYYGGLKDTEKWRYALLHKCDKDSWTLLDIAPDGLNDVTAPVLLDKMMRRGDNGNQQAIYHRSEDEPVYSFEVLAKINNETTSFYRRFENKGALTSIAWIDNKHIWIDKKPTMANLMRHAAIHHPEDVLGSYLVWASDSVYKDDDIKRNMFSRTIDSSQNEARIIELRELAQRVNLDTSSYESHSAQCIALYEGLGLKLTPARIFEYARAAHVPQAPAFDSSVSLLFD